MISTRGICNNHRLLESIHADRFYIKYSFADFYKLFAVFAKEIRAGEKIRR